MTKFTKRCRRLTERWRTKIAGAGKVFLTLFLLGYLTTGAFAQCPGAVGTIAIDGNPCDWSRMFSNPTPGVVKQLFKDSVATIPDDIFTQGSADVNDINTWAWSDNGSNDKNDLGNAGVALIGCNLYFFADRHANNGDAAIGFWFLQDDVAKIGVSGGTFSGVHLEGDLLLVSHFVNGGSQPEIQAYVWTGGALDPTPLALVPGVLDAAVNLTAIAAPAEFNYTPKSVLLEFIRTILFLRAILIFVQQVLPLVSLQCLLKHGTLSH